MPKTPTLSPADATISLDCQFSTGIIKDTALDTMFKDPRVTSPKLDVNTHFTNSLDQNAAAIMADTVLVAIQKANPGVGTVTPFLLQDLGFAHARPGGFLKFSAD